MTNVIKFPGPTLQDIDATSMLREIAEMEPVNALVITWNDNDEVSYHSSSGDHKVIYWYVMGMARYLQENFHEYD